MDRKSVLQKAIGGSGKQMMKCDPRAFARCQYSAQCGDSPNNTAFYEGSECDYFNQKVLDTLPTNADRIRAMSDEEILDFLKRSIDNAYMCKVMRTEPMFLTLAWLQQPAEED